MPRTRKCFSSTKGSGTVPRNRDEEAPINPITKLLILGREIEVASQGAPKSQVTYQTEIGPVRISYGLNGLICNAFFTQTL